MHRLLTITALALGLHATNVWAQEDEDSFTNYESIVAELKTSADEPVKVETRARPLNLKLQGGLGLTASFVSLELDRLNTKSSGVLKGFEAHIGTEFLTRTARAEAVFRNFAHDALSNNVAADLRELEARLVFLPELAEQSVLRMGAGVSERFIDVRARRSDGEVQTSWATPYYSLLLGFEYKLARNVAVGPDLAHHASLDASSDSKSSWDASFRLNATF